MLGIQRMAQASAVDTPQMIKMQLDLPLSVGGRLAWKGLAVDRAVFRQHRRPGGSRSELRRLTGTILPADLEPRLKLLQQRPFKGITQTVVIAVCPLLRHGSHRNAA